VTYAPRSHIFREVAREINTTLEGEWVVTFGFVPLLFRDCLQELVVFDGVPAAKAAGDTVTISKGAEEEVGNQLFESQGIFSGLGQNWSPFWVLR
jgi:hypothetical protein